MEVMISPMQSQSSLQQIRDHLNFAAYFCDFRQNISQGINRLAVFNIEMNRDLSCYHPPIFSHHPFGD